MLIRIVTATDWARRKAPLISTRGDVLQEGNGKLKGEAAVAVPTSGDHHEPHEIARPLSACTLVTDGNLMSLHGKRSIGAD
jgi:hypothetical protein